VDRVRVWLAVSPLVAAGVVVSHTLAYSLTVTPAGPVHGYLGHAPQLLLVLGIAGLALGGLESFRLESSPLGSARLRPPGAWPFPAVALATFVVQEHLERYVHTGHVPVLFGSRTFVVGLLLQLPVALVAWALARRLLRALGHAPAGPPRVPRYLVGVVPAPAGPARAVAAVTPRGRGPPFHHAS
jgi:hypothetical protein